MEKVLGDKLVCLWSKEELDVELRSEVYDILCVENALISDSEKLYNSCAIYVHRFLKREIQA